MENINQIIQFDSNNHMETGNVSLRQTGISHGFWLQPIFVMPFITISLGITDNQQ